MHSFEVQPASSQFCDAAALPRTHTNRGQNADE